MSRTSRRAAPTFPATSARVGRGGAEQSALQRPQRPLRESIVDAARAEVPSGLGLDTPAVRARMVQRVRALGVRDERVLTALAAVPRHQFVDSALAIQAYEDTSLPIGHGQTVSKPSVVARMIELALDGASARKLGNLGRVLEVGTGCGYQAAVLMHLARSVVSVERIEPLFERARECLAPWRGHRGLADLRLVYGDGRRGHAPNAPYATVIAAAGGDELPPAWLDQLAPGGRLVAPLQEAPRETQRLVVVDRDESGRLQRTIHEAVHFVPLRSGLA